MIIFAILIPLVIYVYIQYIQDFLKTCALMNKFNGPPRRLLGSDLVTIERTVLPMLMEYATSYDDVFCTRIGFRWFLFMKDIKSIEYILTSTRYIDKSHNYHFLRSWLGKGLLTSTGKKWKKQRRMITPSFHFNILQDFIPVFNSCSNKLVSKLEAELGRNSFDTYTYIPACTLDIICETAMGISVNTQDNSKSDYVEATCTMASIVIERMLSILKTFDWSYRFTQTYRTEQRVLETLRNFVKNVIRKKRATINDNSTENQVDELGIKKRRAFLDMLLMSRDENGEPMTDEELEDEVHTFMFGGHDTTATSISFTLYLLANNLDEQQKAYEELFNIFGDDDRDCTYQDIQRMQYLEQIIKESLRVYPSVPFYSRELIEDAEYLPKSQLNVKKILLGGKIIPKGTTVTIFAYGIHRDPKIYPEPEKFDPERFSRTPNRSPYAYIPFSAGPRNCIGQRYAMLEMKTILSKLLRCYKILPSVPEHKLILTQDAILRSKNGVLIRIERR
ncbi:cytochrome p450 [Rhyzopertha dominica]|nr:cytochrome p450 [Rhyzopertha dominica]